MSTNNPQAVSKLTVAQQKVADYLEYYEEITAEDIGPAKRFRREVLNKMVATGLLYYCKSEDSYQADVGLDPFLHIEARAARAAAADPQPVTVDPQPVESVEPVEPVAPVEDQPTPAIVPNDDLQHALPGFGAPDKLIPKQQLKLF